MQRKTLQGFGLLLALCLLITYIASQNQIVEAKVEPGITNNEIKLGSSYPFKAPSGWHQGFFDGVDAYFKYLNINGGIYGRNIRMVYLDDDNLPQKAIVNTNTLVLRENIFALFNSSPSAATQIAAHRSTSIDRRGIPNLAVTASYSGLNDLEKYSTTFPVVPNGRQEARMILHFLENKFGETPFQILVESSDLESDFIGASGKNYSRFGRSQMYIQGMIPIASEYPTDLSGILIFGSRTGVFDSNDKMRVKATQFPLVVRGAAVSGFLPESELTNTFFNHYLPAFSDIHDPYIAFFLEIFRQYAPGKPVTQAMVEGANAAYITAQALARIGKNPTRAKLIAFLRKDAKSLSTAAYWPLDYSGSEKSGEFVQTIYTFNGKNSVKATDYFLVNKNGSSIASVTPQRLALLPKGLPLLTESVVSSSTITCKKGKVTRVISGIDPKCPAGFRKI